MFASVEEVGRICTEEAIPADFRKGGILSPARGSHQLPMIQASYAAYEPRSGRSFQTSDGRGVPGTCADYKCSRRPLHSRGSECPSRPTGAGAGSSCRAAGRCHLRKYRDPGGLLRSRCTFDHSDCRLRAKRAILLAGEAYLTRFPQFHRSLLPMCSLISLTEPLSDAQWRKSVGRIMRVWLPTDIPWITSHAPLMAGFFSGAVGHPMLLAHGSVITRTNIFQRSPACNRRLSNGFQRFGEFNSLTTGAGQWAYRAIGCLLYSLILPRASG
jgi:hypothetical protein